jgi:hypothetical protein
MAVSYGAGGVAQVFHRLVEVEDDGQSVTVLAIKFVPLSLSEARILRDKGIAAENGAVLLYDLQNQICTHDPYQWPSLGSPYPRTLPVVHQYLIHNFDNLPPGVVYRLNVAQLLDAKLDPTEGMPSSEDDL